MGIASERKAKLKFMTDLWAFQTALRIKLRNPRHSRRPRGCPSKSFQDRSRADDRRNTEGTGAQDRRWTLLIVSISPSQPLAFASRIFNSVPFHLLRNC